MTRFLRPNRPKQMGSLSPEEEYALENWEYFDTRCDHCEGWVPEFEPVIHDVWRPYHGKLPKKVYCSHYCYHADKRTEWYEADELPNRMGIRNMPELKL